MKIFSCWILLSMIISPIWPLGPNPLPGDPFIIVNKKTNHLVFFMDKKMVYDVKAATGKSKQDTPEGLFTITTKFVNPEYTSKKIPGKDPKNPLGTRWMGFDAKGTNGRVYGIHGTNKPSSIGHYVSSGCIRLDNTIVEKLFDYVPLGTKIYIYNDSTDPYQIAKRYHAI